MRTKGYICTAPLLIFHMEIHKLLANLVSNPKAEINYLKLQQYYLASDMSNEATAFGSLIELKFGKNVNNTHIDTKQREDNTPDARVC